MLYCKHVRNCDRRWVTIVHLLEFPWSLTILLIKDIIGYFFSRFAPVDPRSFTFTRVKFIFNTIGQIIQEPPKYLQNLHINVLLCLHENVNRRHHALNIINKIKTISVGINIECPQVRKCIKNLKFTNFKDLY